MSCTKIEPENGYPDLACPSSNNQTMIVEEPHFFRAENTERNTYTPTKSVLRKSWGTFIFAKADQDQEYMHRPISADPSRIQVLTLLVVLIPVIDTLLFMTLANRGRLVVILMHVIFCWQITFFVEPTPAQIDLMIEEFVKSLEVFVLITISILTLHVLWYQKHSFQNQKTELRRLNIILSQTQCTGQSQESKEDKGSFSYLIYNQRCGVCLEEFTPGEYIALLSCFHGFHITCITSWVKQKDDAFCPFCLTQIIR